MHTPKPDTSGPRRHVRLYDERRHGLLMRSFEVDSIGRGGSAHWQRSKCNEVRRPRK